MADEKKPLTDQETGDAVQPTPEYTEGEADRLPEAETAVDEAVNKAIEASEDVVDTPVVEAFDQAVTAVHDAVESLEPERDEGVSDLRRPMIEAAVADVGHDHTADHGAGGHAEFLSDTTTVFGRTVTVQGGIYTVVFGFLAVATIVEVLVGSLPLGVVLIPILLAIAVIKAVLVVMYYMHLKTDSRLFTYILLLPTIIAGAALLYLLAVPTTGY